MTHTNKDQPTVTVLGAMRTAHTSQCGAGMWGTTNAQRRDTPPVLGIQLLGMKKHEALYLKGAEHRFPVRAVINDSNLAS